MTLIVLFFSFGGGEYILYNSWGWGKITDLKKKITLMCQKVGPKSQFVVSYGVSDKC